MSSDVEVLDKIPDVSVDLPEESEAADTWHSTAASSTPAGNHAAVKSSSFSLPAEDASQVVDFLTVYSPERIRDETEQVSSKEVAGRCTLLDLIRSTLPLNNWVGIRGESFHRYTSGWTLKPGKKCFFYDSPLRIFSREPARIWYFSRLSN
jgi:hypothetical protein